MAINKVEYNGNTLIDLTNDTITAADLATGVTAHDAGGNPIVGTASEKNTQVDAGISRTASTSYTTLRSLTVGKTGTYDIYWVGFRTSTSGTFGTCLYIDDVLHGSEYTSWNNHGQHLHLTSVSLTEGQTLTVRGKSRGSGYYTYIANLLIVEQ